MKKYEGNFEYLMIKRFCKTTKNHSEKYTQVPSMENSEFSVWFFFNRMGCLFNRKDHFHFHIFIHILKYESFHVIIAIAFMPFPPLGGIRAKQQLCTCITLFSTFL